MKFDFTKEPHLDYIEFEVASFSSVYPNRNEVKHALRNLGIASPDLLASIDSASEERLEKIANVHGLRLEAGQIALRYINKYEPLFYQAIAGLVAKNIVPPGTDYTTLFITTPNSGDVGFSGQIHFPRNISHAAKVKLQDIVDYYVPEIQNNIREELGIFRQKTGLEITWNYPHKTLGRS